MRRYNIPGQVHFITTKTNKNRPYFNDLKCSNILLEEIVFYKKRYDFRIFGYVIMPNHLHVLIEPNDKIDISKIIQGIKTLSAKRIKRYFFFNNPTGSWDDVVPATPTGFWFKNFHLWQPSFYDFNIYTDKKFNEKLNYIHNNPVKAGLVRDIEDWIYSSWHNYNCSHRSLIDIDFME